MHNLIWKFQVQVGPRDLETITIKTNDDNTGWKKEIQLWLDIFIEKECHYFY